MEFDADAQLLASDVSRAWKSLVADAKENVRVYTPYFDFLLVRLLTGADLPTSAICVVTDLSPRSGNQQYRAQLLATRALLRIGVTVRSLGRLHAKVLLADDRVATIGSQNFTRYATESHETTVAGLQHLGKGDFLSTLDAWLESAIPVSEEFVESLLTELDEEMAAAAAANGRLVDAFDERWKVYVHALEEAAEADRLRAQRQQELEAAQRERAQRPQASKDVDRRDNHADLAATRDAFRRRLGQAVAKQRQAQQSVWAAVRHTGGWMGYSSFLPDDPQADFTNWIVQGSGGTGTLVSLTRYRMYPLILNPSGRIAFARVVKTRISYLRFAVGPLAIGVLGGYSLQAQVELPETDTEEANLHITVFPLHLPVVDGVRLRIQFDGAAGRLRGWEPAGRRTEGERRWDPSPVLSALDDPDAVDQLTARVLESFRYKTLDVGKLNAAEFFPAGGSRVSLLQFAGLPVLSIG
jgi:hypothetical protein